MEALLQLWPTLQLVLPLWPNVRAPPFQPWTLPLLSCEVFELLQLAERVLGPQAEPHVLTAAAARGGTRLFHLPRRASAM